MLSSGCQMNCILQMLRVQSWIYRNLVIIRDQGNERIHDFVYFYLYFYSFTAVSHHSNGSRYTEFRSQRIETNGRFYCSTQDLIFFVCIEPPRNLSSSGYKWFEHSTFLVLLPCILVLGCQCWCSRALVNRTETNKQNRNTLIDCPTSFGDMDLIAIKGVAYLVLFIAILLPWFWVAFAVPWDVWVFGGQTE